MSDYLVVIKGKPSGPYSTEQLKELNIRPGTFLKTREMDDYKEAHEIPELRALLGFKNIISAPQYYASLDLRLLALIIDYFLIFIVYCFIATVIVFWIDEKQMRIVVSLAGLAVIPIVRLIYGMFMECSARQASFGKVLLGLKVTDEKGERISFGRSVVRSSAKILSTASLGFGYIYGFFDKRQQCLHDRIAGTLVIKDRLIQ